MRIRYTVPDPSFPPLVQPKPNVNEEDQKLLGLARPPALPSHCKPWIDANALGLLLSFPYQLTIQVVGQKSDQPRIHVIKSFGYQPRYRDIIANFSTNHFGLATHYRIKTDPGIGLLISPLPDGYARAADPVRGLVETWWYPKPLFLVYAVPGRDEVIEFSYGDPLCVLIPVPCGQMDVKRMTPKEEREVREQQRQYEEYLAQHPELRWTSAEGHGFSRQYKLYSRRNALRNPSRKRKRSER